MTQEIDIGDDETDDYSDAMEKLNEGALEDADTFAEYMAMTPDERDCHHCGEVFEPDAPHDVLCFGCFLEWITDVQDELFPDGADGEGAGDDA